MERLEDQIRTLMGKAGLGIKGVFKMDAASAAGIPTPISQGSARTSGSSFRYLIGIPHAERDSRCLVSRGRALEEKACSRTARSCKTLSLAVSYFVAKYSNWPLLYRTFGFREPIAYVGLFLIGALSEPS